MPFRDPKKQKAYNKMNNRRWYLENIKKKEEYRLAHKTERIVYDKERYLIKREEILFNRNLNKDELNLKRRIYNKTDNGKRNNKRQCARRRILGYIPINKPFNGCEGHHVDMEYVVYIPKEVHRSINHNVRTWHNMDAINILTIPYI